MDNIAPNKPYVGGQAVIEGVMMRSPRCLAIAVRRADGSIVIRDDVWMSIWHRLKFLRWPFIRGSIILAESVYNGIQAINFAAGQAELDAPPPDPKKDAKKDAHKTGSAGNDAAPAGRVTEPAAIREATEADGAEERASAGASGQGMGGTIAVSLLLAVALFIGLPHFLAWTAGKVFGGAQSVDSFAFHALDGLFKLMIFVGYIGGISLIPEIRRVFEYHGAEHKVVNLYENGRELTVDNAVKETTFHARCGTSFVLFVLVLSILLFAMTLPLVPVVSDSALVNHVAVVILKVPLMLPLAGFAYEINRYAAAHPNQWWVQLLVQPGRLMQKLTTREPSVEQIEIALVAMRTALGREAEIDEKSPVDARVRDLEVRSGQVIVFRNYSETLAAIPSGH